MADRAHDYADAVQLASVRADLKAREGRLAEVRREILNNESFEENARMQAWMDVGRVTGDPNNRNTWKCPPGWPAPYQAGFEAWLRINLPGWADMTVSTTELGDHDKYLRAFKDAVGR